jgi:endoglucanase
LSHPSFLRAHDARLVDGQGNPVLLRGVGLGNWLLPEGYMWKFEPPGPQSPREIEALLVDLVGPERAAQFWTGFQRHFITDADLAHIAAEGLNHVRLPINSRSLLTDSGDLRPDGFAPIDWLIDRCRAHGLWVVLDLHAAPGGQTGTNIDDSPRGLPELFMERRYQEQTVRLWQALARRYRDQPAVAGYDLLNEPLPSDYQHRYADDLVSLYGELTAAIRAVDPEHLIIYEGTHWASNWDIFTEVWDPQSVLQFHRYWSPPDRPGIQTFLDVRERLGLPIYMGEGGENNLDWLQTAFQLYEDEEISWNFWPWKKMETLTSPCSVTAPTGWTEIVQYATGQAPRPDLVGAWRTLEDLLASLHPDRCVYRPEVVNALLRRAPLRLPATGFSFRGEGQSYKTTGASPLTGFRLDDRVTIVRSAGLIDEPLDFSHNGGAPRGGDDRLLVRLEPGDWVSYDVHIATTTRLKIMVHGETPQIQVRLDDTDVPSGPVAIGAQVATTASLVRPGRHEVRITATHRALLDGLEITPVP